MKSAEEIKQEITNLEKVWDRLQDDTDRLNDFYENRGEVVEASELLAASASQSALLEAKINQLERELKEIHS